MCVLVRQVHVALPTFQVQLVTGRRDSGCSLDVAGKACTQPRFTTRKVQLGIVAFVAQQFCRKQRRTVRRSLEAADVAQQLPREYLEVQVAVGEPEIVTDLFLGFGSISTATSSQPEQPGIFLVTAIFDAASDLTTLPGILQDVLDLPCAPTLTCRPLGRGAWIDHFPLSNRLEVCLPCHEGVSGGSKSTSGRRVLRLEGSLAFGAGDHPTTRGAAAFLEQTIRPGVRVLDFGTGSGVLALCASMFGAGYVLGLDIDSSAVASARRSALLNTGLQGQLEFRQVPSSPVEALALVSELDGQFDVVVANILCGPLLHLAPAIAAAAKPGATLCLTGLRAEQGDTRVIQDAYSETFVEFEQVDLELGWTLLQARRCPV